jgi:transcriptional regulator with XRE-family HTH domain
MPPLSQIVTLSAIGGREKDCHNLCVVRPVAECDFPFMESDKNAGPNYLRQWRRFRGLTLEDLAKAVGTNPNMIGYLESGERGLSAKWLRRLAPALSTTPGLLLDHDPYDLDSDIVDIWINGSDRQRRQIAEIAKALIKTGTEG